MAYKVLTKQQWDSLPSYKKYQMRAYSPDLYNYYQDRYVPKAEPVAKKERDTGTEKRSAPFTDQTSEGFETRWADFIEALSPRERALLEAAGLLGSGTATDASRRQRADLMSMFDAGYGINNITLQQVRAMNAGARGELQEKLKWINERISEGYTREEARHLYYEWGGEGQELNPNKTLSDEIIADTSTA
jgi:hypothetical protein